MALTSQHIILTEGDERIEIFGRLRNDSYTTELELHVNGELQDQLVSTPKNGILGCRLFLSGTLKNSIPVKVQLRANAFMRPEYTFYVNGAVIYIKKGTWGGM
ncbi:MAG: hypothetical protein V4812_18065 [Pseudomonadota bacterium]